MANSEYQYPYRFTSTRIPSTPVRAGKMDTGENQFVAVVAVKDYTDHRGLPVRAGDVIGGYTTRTRAADFLKTLAAIPVDMSIPIVMGGWPVDADGRGLSVLEVEQQQQQHKARAA